MEERHSKDIQADETLEVPDPVALQLQRSGRDADVRVVTDKPPPVRRRGFTGYSSARSTRR